MRANRSWACLAFVAFLALFSLSAAAADPSCPDPAVPLSVLLMPPPKSDSAQTKAELQELLRLQESRTPDQAKHVRDDDHRTLERFLGGIGIKVESLSASANREAKNTFNRTRPYRLPHNNLHTLKKLSDRDSPSYPSAHATYGAVMGMVLAEMIPEKKEELYKRIQDYGYSRIVSGALRGDVYAGNVAGAALAASLLSKEAFRNELNDVKGELRKAAGLAP
ncbi:MAG TPA: phosphatase PAP2 family protein [Pseudolabrys sp.]|nr:phosphatase PAP2 family protein [Pseudolabrys sp.]